jgi:hypothetical protein
MNSDEGTRLNKEKRTILWEIFAHLTARYRFYTETQTLSMKGRVHDSFCGTSFWRNGRLECEHEKG